MGATKLLLTAEQFDNYPFEEDKRYELDEGELIEMTRPAYLHNRILKNLTFELEAYCRKSRVGEVMISENLYALSPTIRRAPDLAVVLGGHRTELQGARVISVIPDIAVEILSPNETSRKIHRKLKQYFAAGGKEIWLVDPETQEAEIWTGPALSDARDVTETLASPLLPGFSLSLADLFQ